MARKAKIVEDTAEEVQTEEDNVVQVSKNIFDRSKYAYAKNGVKTPTGRPSVDNGDALAVALRGKSADDCVALVEENGLEVPEGWARLNAGMRRMNASNVLRRLAKGDGATIDGKTIRIETEAA